MNKLKVLMINPPYTHIVGMPQSGGNAVPLNILYLISYLRKDSDMDISFFDCEAEVSTYKDIEKYFEKNHFDLVGMTCPTPVFNIVNRISRIIKNKYPNTKIVIGGPHPSALPYESLTNNIDFIVMQQGELTLYELCQALKNGEGDFSKIQGLGYKKDGKVKINSPRPFLEDIDQLPFPARDIVDLDKYCSAPTKMVSGEKSTSLLCSRGCCFNCTHCISNLMYGRKVAVRSSKNIVDEIEECYKKYGIKEFKFDDDNIALFKNILFDVCKDIKKRKLKISWMCMSRVDAITPELAKAMKGAGCKKISFGLESGSPTVLKLMRKKADLDTVRKAVRILHKLNIDLHASFMIGNVGETNKTIRQTINFAKSLDLDYATFFITSPYPGTDLYTIAKEKGYITNHTKWEEFAPITDQNPIVVQDNLTPEQLINWQKIAFKEFYFRPKQIFRKISKVRSIKQAKALIKGLSIFRSVLGRKLK